MHIVLQEQPRARQVASFGATFNFFISDYEAEDQIRGQYSRADRTREWLTGFIIAEVMKALSVIPFSHFSDSFF